MKRFIILLCLVVVSVAACTKEYVVPNKTIITEVPLGSWLNVNNQDRVYSAVIDMPEINDFVNENHGILVYISLGDRTYEQLPQVYDGVSYRYEVRPGQIVITLESSDGIDIISPPPAMTVKIVLIESL